MSVEVSLIYTEDLESLESQGKARIELREDIEGYRFLLELRGIESFESIDRYFRRHLDEMPEDQLEDFVEFYRQNVKEEAANGVYGSSNPAMRAVQEKQAKGVSGDDGDWAVDAARTWFDIPDSSDQELYQEAMTRIDAKTLQAVSLAQSPDEQRTEDYSFYLDMAENPFQEPETGTGPVEIEVEPETQAGEDAGELEQEGFDYDQMVSGTIKESKHRIEEVEDQLDEQDWEALLEAEGRGKDRVTFKPYLEKRLEEERQGSEE